MDDHADGHAHELSRDSARLRLLYDLGCGFAARIELDELCALVRELDIASDIQQ